MEYTEFSHLLSASYEKEVIQWLQDDCPSFDVGGFVVGDKRETAVLYCKAADNCVLAGVPFADAILQHLGLTYEWLIEEGHVIPCRGAGGKVEVARVSGACNQLLLAERTLLVSRCSFPAPHSTSLSPLPHPRLSCPFFSWSEHPLTRKWSGHGGPPRSRYQSAL